MPAYYNEIDPYAAQWLRNLIAAGHIAPGDVDERSIVDVKPDDLIGYNQCHFFAGIGGWSLAARLAGWPDDRPLWTGSCPCQPFSAAGKRKGEADERHLWPVLASLVRERRPPVVAGEQVASKDGLRWLDGVCADLEASNYTVWAADFCAASVGAPHIRQRLWWLADSNSQRHDRQHPLLQRDQQGRVTQDSIEASGGGIALRLADSIGKRGCSGTARGGDAGDAWQSGQDDWGSHHVRCADGKSRRVEPSIQPLAHGVSNRVGRLRAYGNAIVPQVAAEILRAYLD
jgi:DNA (cytosine-5)-methyltransferase 1